MAAGPSGVGSALSESNNATPPWRSTLLFFLLALFICSWHLDHGSNANTVARALSVASIVDRGTLEITPLHELATDKAVVNGRYYSDKAPLPTLIVLPFHWLAVNVGFVQSGEHGSYGPPLLRLGGFLCGSVPLALLIVLAWRRLRNNADPFPGNAAMLAALPLLGSFLYVYSGSFYNHLPAALFGLLAAMAFERGHWYSVGLWGGAAFACESSLLLFPAIWGLQLLLQRQWRAGALIAGGMLPALLLTAAHNLVVTGEALTFPNAYAANFSEMHQRYGFGTWQPRAFFGLLLSDHRGLLFYMPFLWVAAIVLFQKLSRRRFLRDPYVLPSIVLVLVFMTHATWAGGWTYGPRYLMTAAVLIAFRALPLLENVRWQRIAIPVLSLFGLLCAVAAKMTVSYSLPTDVLHPLLSEVLPHLRQGEWTDMQLPVLLGASPATATLLFVPIFAFTLYAMVRVDRCLPCTASSAPN